MINQPTQPCVALSLAWSSSQRPQAWSNPPNSCVLHIFCKLPFLTHEMPHTRVTTTTSLVRYSMGLAGASLVPLALTTPTSADALTTWPAFKNGVDATLSSSPPEATSALSSEHGLHSASTNPLATACWFAGALSVAYIEIAVLAVSAIAMDNRSTQPVTA